MKPFEIDSGEAIATKNAMVQSTEFQSCNLFVLKNMTTGDVLVMHNYLGKPSMNPRHIETTDRYFRVGRNPFSMKPVHGISKSQAPQLREFLETAGDKYAFSVYKYDHGAAEVLGVVGSENDGGITAFLESKGVKTARHSIEEFERAGYNTKDGFHAEYDVAADRLKISKAETRWGDSAKGEEGFSLTFLPAEHTGNLLDTQIFKDLSIFQASTRSAKAESGWFR